MAHPDIENRMQRIYNAFERDIAPEVSARDNEDRAILTAMALALEQLAETLSDIKRMADALETIANSEGMPKL